MTRNWKPGDVAMVSDERGATRVAVRTNLIDARHHWAYDEVGIGRILSDIRPLVVIDPEDPESVERLLSAYHGWKWNPATRGPSIGDMQAALREIADPTPPKPDEPMGLGAVISTESDGDYIHVSLEHARPWLNVQTRRSFRWDDVAAVRILSEGVQP